MLTMTSIRFSGSSTSLKDNKSPALSRKPSSDEKLIPTPDWDKLFDKVDNLPLEQQKKLTRLVETEVKKVNFPSRKEIDVDIRDSGESTPYAISWLESLNPTNPNKNRYHHPESSSFINYVRQKDWNKALITLAGLNPRSPGVSCPGTPKTTHYEPGNNEASYIDKDGTKKSTSLDITELHRRLDEVYKSSLESDGQTWVENAKGRFHHPLTSSLHKDFKCNRPRAIQTLEGDNPDSPGISKPGTPTHPKIVTGPGGFFEKYVQGKVIASGRS